MAFVKYPTAKQFKKDLDNKKLEKVYLFLGEEEGEKDKYIHTILDMIFDNPEDKKNSSGRFHIENDELMAGADFALAQSMFSNRKVCIIMNIHKLSSSKKSELILDDMLNDSPDSTTIIMTSTENSPPRWLGKDMLKKIKVVQFWRYFDQDVFNYVTLNLKKAGFSVDDKAIQLLIEYTGKDIRKIDDAIDLITYSGETGYISVDVIKSLIHDVKDVSIFEFIDLLFKKDKKALKLVKKLLEEGNSELSVLSRIAWQIDSIEKYHAAVKKGMARDEAVKASGVYDRNKINFLHYVKYFNLDRVKKLYHLIAQADMRIKSSSVSKDIVANPLFNLVSEILIEV